MCVGYTNNKTYRSDVDREMVAHVWTLPSEGRHSIIHCLHATQMGRIGSKMKEMTKVKRYSLSEVLRYERNVK